MTKDSDFLSRWSRRKLEPVAEAAPAPETEPDAPDAPALTEAEAAEMTDAEILERLELPDPAKMIQGDDFKPFMKDMVPQRIRRLALRRLWRLDPVLANLDELIDYGDDFTDAATVVENMQTTYNVGKGMQAHLDALEEQARAKAEAEAAAEAEDPAESEEPDAEASDIAEDAGEVAEDPAETAPEEALPEEAEDQLTALEEPELEAEVMPRPRRMSFSFGPDEAT